MGIIKALRYFLVIFMFSGYTAAAAQEIPLPLLESDRKSCKASCTQTFSGKECTQLCDCTISAFRQKVDFDHYLQLIAEISQNKLSKANITLMDNIALQCMSNVEKPTVLAVSQPSKQ